jgi:single-strand DNA-binding protein
MNLVIEMGNLTRDVELRYLPNGSAVADFSIAVNSKYKPKDGGEVKEEVDFFQVTVWGKTAENCAEYIGKGSKVLVQGKLKQEQWEAEGKKHSRVKIVAQTVQFLNNKKGSSGTGGAQAGESDEPIPF